MNTLQKTILDAAKRNARIIRDAIGQDNLNKVLTQLEREEKSHRAWGFDFKRCHPHAPSVANCAIVDLSCIWREIPNYDLGRKDMARIRYSFVLIWSLSENRNLDLESADFNYSTFIHGKKEN